MMVVGGRSVECLFGASSFVPGVGCVVGWLESKAVEVVSPSEIWLWCWRLRRFHRRVQGWWLCCRDVVLNDEQVGRRSNGVVVLIVVNVVALSENRQWCWR